LSFNSLFPPHLRIRDDDKILCLRDRERNRIFRDTSENKQAYPNITFFFRKASAGLAYREGWVIFDRYRSAEGKELPLTKPPLFLVLIGKIERSPDEIIEAAKLSRMKKVAISSSNIF